MENTQSIKKGNLIFLKSTLIDLFYIVKGIEGEMVVARKIDAPPAQWEKLSIDKVVKVAEEQEKILLTDVATVAAAIEEQRKVIFAPLKSGKKRESLEKMIKRLPREGIEEILAILAAAGVKEGGDE